MSMETLFAYATEFRDSVEQVDEMLEMGHSVDSPEVQEVLQDMASIDTDFDNKAVRCGLYIRELRAHAEKARAESQRLSKIAQSAEKRADSLCRYVQMNMQSLGKDKIFDPFCPLTLTTSEAVEVSDPELLPKQYLRVKYEADKVALKRDRPSIPGVSYVTHHNLRVGT